VAVVVAAAAVAELMAMVVVLLGLVPLDLMVQLAPGAQEVVLPAELVVLL